MSNSTNRPMISLAVYLRIPICKMHKILPVSSQSSDEIMKFVHTTKEKHKLMVLNPSGWINRQAKNCKEQFLPIQQIKYLIMWKISASWTINIEYYRFKNLIQSRIFSIMTHAATIHIDKRTGYNVEGKYQMLKEDKNINEYHKRF